MPLPAVLASLAAGNAGRAGLGSVLTNVLGGGQATGLGNVLNSLGGGTDKARTKLASFADGAQKLGSDLGFAIAGFSQFGGLVKGLGSAALAAVNPMTYVNEAFKVAGHGVQLLLAPLNSLNAVAQTVSGILGTVVDTATGLGSAVKPFVDRANPAESKMFELASNDLLGAIGHGLIPAMHAGTAITRAFADVIFALSPSMKQLTKLAFDPLAKLMPTLVQAAGPMVDAFDRFATMVTQTVGPAVGSLASAFGEVATEWGQAMVLLLEAMAPVQEVLVAGVAGAFHLLAMAARASVAPLKMLIDALGIRSTPREMVNRSLGAGVSNAQFGGVEDFYKSVVLQAFKLGAGPADKKDTGAETVSYLSMIHGLLAKFDADAIARKFASAIKDVLPFGGAGAGGVAGGLVGALVAPAPATPPSGSSGVLSELWRLGGR